MAPCHRSHSRFCSPRPTPTAALLSKRELKTVVDVARRPALSVRRRRPSRLREPPKATRSPPREVEAVVFDRVTARTYEARVDLGAKKTLRGRHRGRAARAASRRVRARGTLVRADARWRAALEKRGDRLRARAVEAARGPLPDRNARRAARARGPYSSSSGDAPTRAPSRCRRAQT